MTIDIYQIVDCANNIANLDELCKEYCKNNNDSSLCDFKIDKIPKTIPQNSYPAYLARKLALDGLNDSNFSNQFRWQTYWFKCCISENCNFIFLYLQQKDVDREDDLEKICNHDSQLWKKLGNDGMKGYLDTCIDFLLIRYDWLGAFCLYRRYPNKKNINLVKLFYPRLFSAILLGFFLIAISGNTSVFENITQLNLLIYSILLFVTSVIYFTYECYSKIRGTLVNKGYISRIFFVLFFGSIYSFIFSIMFSKAGFLGNGELNLARVIFYTMLALFIGIIIQLLWEEKTVTEPL